MIKDDKKTEQEKDADSTIPSEPVRIRVVGVRCRPGWPAEHFDTGALTLSDGEWVIIPTDHGIEVGQVRGTPIEITIPEDKRPPRIERLASTYEIEQYYNNIEREKRAWQVCAEKIRALGLSMKLVRVESFYNGSKIIFYYSADDRVDFRELVRELVRELKCRVEMRQIGVRHEAKMVGGIGNCGRPLCCASFLRTFDPISIRMAKAQNLPLNPNKISGLCGRLLCCLTFEYDTYVELIKKMPSLGKSCDTPSGEGKIIRQNVLRQTVTVALSSGGEAEFSKKELDDHRRGGKSAQKKHKAPAAGKNGKGKGQARPSSQQATEEPGKGAKPRKGRKKRRSRGNKKRKGQRPRGKGSGKQKTGKD